MCMHVGTTCPTTGLDKPPKRPNTSVNKDGKHMVDGSGVAVTGLVRPQSLGKAWPQESGLQFTSSQELH